MTGGNNHRIVGPARGSDLPPAWDDFITKNMKTWASCRLRSHWYAVLVDNEVVAAAALDAEWGIRTGWMGPTFVSESHRGHGLQGQLIQVRVGLAKTIGLDRLCSATDLTNGYSLRNLLNAKFKIAGYNEDANCIEVEYQLV